MASSILFHSTPMLNLVFRFRKLRNRLSQRAFRLRQAKKTKELRDRVENSQSQDLDREQFLALQQENDRLRKHIELLQARTDDVQASLRAMSQSTSRILESGKSPEAPSTASNMHGSGQNPEPSAPPHLAPNATRNDRQNPVAESDNADDADDVICFQGNTAGSARPSRPRHETNAAESTSADQLSDWPLLSTAGDPSFLGNVQTTTPNVSCPHGHGFGNMHLNLNVFEDDLGLQDHSNLGHEELQSIPPGIPNVWNFDYQMGSDSYANAIDAIRPSAVRLGWMESNSPISDHIRTLKSFLSVKFKPSDVSVSVCRT